MTESGLYWGFFSWPLFVSATIPVLVVLIPFMFYLKVVFDRIDTGLNSLETTLNTGFDSLETTLNTGFDTLDTGLDNIISKQEEFKQDLQEVKNGVKEINDKLK